MHHEVTGLTPDEAADLLQKYGRNQLPEPKPKAVTKLFFDQLHSPLIYILLAAALATLVLGDYLDTGVILLAVLINTVLGFVQEYKADRTISALKKMLLPQARVIRSGKIMQILVWQIVPGDLVELAAGDRVPADGTVVAAARLFINEALLTGESQSVEKTPGKSQAAMGTIVVSGHGRMRVTATGGATQMGKIAQKLEEAEDEPTPLQAQLAGLARVLTWIVVGVSAGVFGLGVISGVDMKTMFSTAVAVAVSAVPEGMAVALTVVLAVGMRRILERKALVRKLVAAETLGAVTTICVDKTGTITQGVMQVSEVKLLVPDKAVETAVFANNLEDSLEIALWDWAQGGSGQDLQKLREERPRIDEIPFDGKHKYMAVLTGDNQVWVKGAPEKVIGGSGLSSADRSKWLMQAENMGERGLKVLALAGRIVKTEKLTEEAAVKWDLFGLVGISDPVRPGVKEMFAVCHEAGIDVKVVTGDYRPTAEAVMREVGVKIVDPQREIMEGEELGHISETELAAKIAGIRLFCRVTPEDKLKIVNALQAGGSVVAMTGDGVNDAMAIKQANIGIVVGGGSDVARESADIVLLDANFATIVAAIEEGRGIFETIRKVVLYLLAGAFAEIVAIVSALFLGLPLPLTAIQLLWINLVTDGLPSLALTQEAKEMHLLRRRPRSWATPIINRWFMGAIGFVSVTVGLLATFVFKLFYTDAGQLAYARTMSFTVFSLATLFYAFSLRQWRRPLVVEGLTKNRWLVVAVGGAVILQLAAVYTPGAEAVFGTVPLGMEDWMLVLALSLLPAAAIELVKWIRNNRANVV